MNDIPRPADRPRRAPGARRPRAVRLRAVGLACIALAALAGCAEFDPDLRRLGRGLDTSAAALSAVQDRPAPDPRGVISYPGYQVAVARGGDSIADVAGRVGLPPAELARFNGATPEARLNAGEVLVLPRRVAEPAGGVIAPTGVVEQAGQAIDRAEGRTIAPAAAGSEPERHRVAQGETAFSIARRYGVPVAALAEWNGLDRDYTVRLGQVLLIPPRAPGATADRDAAAAVPPGTGTPAPTPPSATRPLPENEPAPAAATAAATAVAAAAPSDPPPAPAPGGARTEASASSARFAAPVSAAIIRDFNPPATSGIDYAATAGTPVRAADDGTVAVVTQDTSGIRVILLRHAGGLTTAYANVDAVTVAAGERVSRGQQIAEVGDADPAVFRFQVNEGVEPVDPNPFLR